jgi:hypothetical protein
MLYADLFTIYLDNAPSGNEATGNGELGPAQRHGVLHQILALQINGKIQPRLHQLNFGYEIKQQY